MSEPSSHPSANDAVMAQFLAELERREGLSGIEEKALRKSREREQNGG